MSVAFSEDDGDGFPDVLVTNDKLPDSLFHNIHGKKFEEVGFAAAIPSPAWEWIFADTKTTSGRISRAPRWPTRPSPFSATWGRDVSRCHLLERHKDPFVSGGHVSVRIAELEPSRYQEPTMVFLKRGTASFRDASADAGENFATLAGAHRGCRTMLYTSPRLTTQPALTSRN